jgi:hypothetical protein
MTSPMQPQATEAARNMTLWGMAAYALVVAGMFFGASDGFGFTMVIVGAINCAGASIIRALAPSTPLEGE